MFFKRKKLEKDLTPLEQPETKKKERKPTREEYVAQVLALYLEHNYYLYSDNLEPKENTYLTKEELVEKLTQSLIKTPGSITEHSTHSCKIETKLMKSYVLMKMQNSIKEKSKLSYG